VRKGQKAGYLTHANSWQENEKLLGHFNNNYTKKARLTGRSGNEKHVFKRMGRPHQRIKESKTACAHGHSTKGRRQTFFLFKKVGGKKWARPFVKA